MLGRLRTRHAGAAAALAAFGGCTAALHPDLLPEHRTGAARQQQQQQREAAQQRGSEQQRRMVSADADRGTGGTGRTGGNGRTGGTDGTGGTDSTDSTDSRHRVVVIGSGPAGHTAAIYLARAELRPVLYEGFLANGIAAGGQLTTTTEVENYPGFPAGIGGGALMEAMRAQSVRVGAAVVTETVARIDLSRRPFRYWTEEDGGGGEAGPSGETDTLVLATGASARRMHLPGEETYWQRGISACAVCDGAVPMFRDRALAVVGGGDSAAEEALFLTRYGSVVFVIVRRGVLRASKVMARRLAAHPKIRILYDTVAVAAHGDGRVLTEVTVRDVRSGGERGLAVSGLFYAIGHLPATALVAGQLALDDQGYVITKPGSTCTSVKGVFAAGDVQDKRFRQAVTSAGSGCMAALECERLLAEEEDLSR